MIKSLRTLVCLAGLLGGLLATGQAQTVVTGTLSASFVCPPGTLTVPFSVTGPFGTGNTFTAQLSDGSGSFTGAPTAVGSITANPSSTASLAITATIPGATAVGAAYKVRVISSVGGRIGVSPTTLAIGTVAPAAPATAPVFCQNSSPASISVVGQNLKWYATSGTVTTATFPVSTTATGPFSVSVTQTVNGCESARTLISYTVTAPPNAPGVASLSVCQGQLTGALSASFAPGATPNWYGTNPTGGSPSTTAPTPSNMNPATYYVSQTVGGCESGRASLTVAVVSLPASPTPVTSPSYCPGDAAAPLSATGQNLRWYGTNATGGTSTTAQTPATTVPGSANYYVSQVVGSCESVRTAISVLVKTRPNAPGVATTPYQYCVGQTALPLEATPVNGGTINWYGMSATGGTASTTAPTPPTTTPGTTNYYVSQTANGCESVRASLTVVVTTVPAAPVPVVPTDYCQGVTASPLVASGQNLRWYGTNATGGTSTTGLTPGTGTAGSTTYYVSQLVSGCESARASVTVRVKDAPDAPMVSAVSFCQNTPAPLLSATAASGAMLNWYTSTTGLATSTAPTPATGTAGNQTFYVSQTLNGCESPKATISVTVKAIPSAPGVTSVSYCFGLPASTLTASPVANASLNWYSAATGGIASATAPVPPTSTTGVTNYYVSQTLNGCEGARATLPVTTNAVPPIPTVAAVGPYCQGSAGQSLSATGQNIRWYGVNATGSTPTATQVTNNATPGIVNYYVSQTVNNCESPRGSIAVQIKTTPGLPVTTAIEFCQNTTAPVLTATTTAGNATLLWYGTNQNGPSSPTPPTLANTTATTLTYYVSQTLDGCEGAKASLAVRIKQKPGIPGTAPVAFCNNEPPQPLTATGQNLTWYDQSNTLIGNTPTPNTSAVGAQTFKVAQTVEGCISDLATVAVTIKARPGAPGIKDLQYCLPTQDQPMQTVGPLTATGQNLRWYNPDGNRYGDTPVPPTSLTATITYQVTQTVNDCEGPKATLQVSVQTTPAPVIPKPLVTYCRDDVAKPLEAVGTNLRWIDPNSTLLPANTTPTPPTLNATVQGPVLYQVYQTGSNGCVSSRASIKVVINTNPTLAVTGATQVNLGQATPLQLHFTGAAPFSYTLSNGVSGTALGDTTVSVVARQTTVYQVVNVANVCGNGLPGDPASAVVTVRTPTIRTDNLNVTTLCAGQTFTVPYSTQGIFNLDLGYQVQLVLATDTSGRNPITLNTPGTMTNPIPVSIPNNTPGGTYVVRVIRTVATSPLIQVLGSGSPSRLTVRALPTAALTGTQNLYEGDRTNLTLTFGGDGPWSFVYVDSIRTFTGTTNVNPYLLPVQPLKTTTYRLTSVNNNCGPGTVTGSATVTVLPLLGVEKDPLSDVVRAYPVPATTRLTVTIDRPLYAEPARLELVDLRGHTTLEQTTRSQQTDLDLSTHPAGLYLLHITLGDHQTTRKILIQ